MAFYSQKQIYINSDTKGRCNIVNGFPSSLFLNSDSLYEGDSFIYCFNLLDSNGVPASYADGGDWYFDITANRNEAILECFNASFNDYQEWEDVDPATGKICVSVDMGTDGITSLLGNSASATVVCELWHRAIDARWTLCGQWGANILNTCYPDYSDMSSESTESSESSESTAGTDGNDSSESSESSGSSNSSDSSVSSESTEVQTTSSSSSADEIRGIGYDAIGSTFEIG